MKYEKPKVVFINAATALIESTQKNGQAYDIPANFTHTVPAYEADE
jgi:hypothetical protein